MTIREISPSKALIQAGWDDCPHLDDKTKADLLASTPPHLRDARSKGTPSLGAGAIYPIEESEIACKPFALPSYWPRAFALDVGWKKTAALWMAWDRSVDCIYLYSEHYRGQAEPSIHATAIRARGEWIPGLIDPAARGRQQKDGEQLWQNYVDLGLSLTLAKNPVESGIEATFERLSTGRLKVFSTLQNFFAEYRIYRRDEKGQIIKANDHLCDCCRYLALKGTEIAQVQPMSGKRSAPSAAADSTVGY